MVTLSFDDVTICMSLNDWEKFRNFMRIAVNTLPVECVKDNEELLGQLGMGYHAFTRLYKEKVADVG